MQFTCFTISVRFALLIGTLLLLNACGSSDSEEATDYNYAYLQFYNASPNGASIEVREVDGDNFGTAQFGDVTSLHSLDEGDIDLEFVRTDADDQEVLVDTLSVSLDEGQKTLVVMSGDFATPTFSAFSFNRDDLDAHFRLFAIGLMAAESRFDVYMSHSGEPFTAAHYVGTAENTSLSELTFWDTDSDSDDFDSGEYTLFLTEPGETDVVFESQTINFQYDTEYVLALRDMSGAIKTGMRVDTLLNTTSVTSISDVDATSQYRLYNSTDETITATFGGNTQEDDDVVTLAPGSLSAFTTLRYGDYRVTAQSDKEGIAALNNKLVTLNQGESKAVMFYQSNDALAATTFIESDLPQSYDKTVNFVSLSADIDNLDMYLVRSDETIDTAEYSVQNLSPAEYASEVLPADYYEIIAVSEDDNGEQTLLDRTALFGFTDEQNYIVTIEPADTPTGYKANVLY